MKKLFCVILLTCTLFALVACGGAQSQTTTPASTTTSEAPGGLPDMVPLVQNGVVNYQIIYHSTTDREYADTLKTFLETSFSVTATVKSDYGYTDAKDGATPQIHVGLTKAQESIAIKAETKYRDWVVEPRGSKIVIFAHTDVNMRKALSEYQKLLTTAAGGTTGAACNIAVPARAGSTTQYSCNQIKFAGVDIQSYRIVYAAGFEEAATMWQAWFANQSGNVLPMVQDKQQADDGGYEILVGPTNRSASQSAYANHTELLDYSFSFQGKKAVTVIGNLTTNYHLFSVTGKKTVTSMILSKRDLKTKISDLPADTVITGSVRTMTANDFLRAENTDLRVMTFNIKSQIPAWDTSGTVLPLAERKPLLKHLLTVTTPDIIGFQEVTGVSLTSVGEDSWNSTLGDLVQELGYATIYLRMDNGTGTNNPNCNPIAYNSAKYNVLKHGFHAFESRVNDTDVAIRNMTWALFEDKATGKAFLFVNGHWTFPIDSSTAIQDAQSQEQVAYVNQLVATYNVPVFCTADYNCNPSSDALRNLMTNAGLTQTGTFAGIDHILYKGGVTELANKRITDGEFTTQGQNPYYLSDHSPIYGDYSLAAQSALPTTLPDFVFTGVPTT